MDNSVSVIPENKVQQISHDEKGLKTINNYKILKLIGQGTYSKVKLGLDLINNKEIAIKIINKFILSKKRKNYTKDKEGNMLIISLLQDALREIDILKSIKHKNIVNLIEILENEDTEKIYLIMEYSKKGAIMDYNEKTKEWSINKEYNKLNKLDYSEDDLRCIVKDIASGLDYLHSNGVVHRDLKPENILVSADNCCKISDFNVSSFIINGEDKFTKTEGTIYFYAPECCKGKSEAFAAKPVDIWALAVTLYIMTFRCLPFISKDNNMYEIINMIAAGELTLPNTRKISNELKDLFKKLFEKDPSKRIKAIEILSHPWILNKIIVKNIKEDKQSSIFACCSSTKRNKEPVKEKSKLSFLDIKSKENSKKLLDLSNKNEIVKNQISISKFQGGTGVYKNHMQSTSFVKLKQNSSNSSFTKNK